MNSESTRQDPTTSDIYQDPTNIILWQRQVKEAEAPERSSSLHIESLLGKDILVPEPTDKFNSITTNITQTIEELTQVYSSIGYSSEEIATKKAEVFGIIEDTIKKIASSLKEEKTNLETECKWLRQQIRIILAIVDDDNCCKNLTDYNRGLVIEEPALCANKNILVDVDEISFAGRSYVKELHDLTLLDLRGKLNEIFLGVLKVFGSTLQKLAELSVSYCESKSLLGEFCSQMDAIELLNALPTQEEARRYIFVLDEFEQASNESSKRDCLRGVTRQIVDIASQLKFPKITSHTLSLIQKEIDACDEQVEIRQSKVRELVDKCIHLIGILQISEEQLIEFQRQYDSLTSVSNDTLSSDGYFDFETLRFIRSNPKNFGLSQDHLSYLHKFADFLQRRKDAKQKKYDSYLASCTELWEKLGESPEYIEMFVAANNTLSDVSLLNFKLELNKLYMKRSECIESFISQVRESIEKMWDQMYYSDAQRAEFKFYHYDARVDTTDKEKVLAEHEAELKSLQADYQKLEPVLSLWDQVTELLKDQNFLKESCKNSSRLLSKNSCKILLNEEKIRKKIAKNLPRLVISLKSEITAYNSASGKPICIDGEDLLQKVSVIEAEQNIRGPKRPAPSSSAPSSAASQKSPTRKPLRTSPNKLASRLNAPKRDNLLGRKHPTLRPHNSTLSNVSATTMRLANAYHSLDSPNKRVHLQPLNTPLVNQKSDRVSAMKLNSQESRMSHSTSFQSKENSSPLKGKDLRGPDARHSSLLRSPERSLAPLSRRGSINTCDSSTLIGDDYQVWRDEQIQSYNM